MKTIVTLTVVFLWSTSSLLCQGRSQQSVKPQGIRQSFLMTVAEDGRQSLDDFEIWQVFLDLAGRTPRCSIQVASLGFIQDETFVALWNHETQRVTEVQPGILKLEMNGRLNPFSGLEVVVELSRDRSRILNLSGSMRSGMRGQSVAVFQVDRKTETRRLPPLRNPSWLLPEK